MDPNLLRHIDYFAVPNNQTVNPVDHNASLATSTNANAPPPAISAADQPSIWDTSALPAEAKNTSMSLGSASRQQNPYIPKTVLPTRVPPQRSRPGHERKRSRLGTDAAAPFDSVDYWVNFEREERAGGQDRPQFNKVKEENPERGRTRTTANPLATPSGSGVTSGNGMASGSGMAVDGEEGVEDSALDNALSDDDDEAFSISLADHLSKIDSAPPTHVPQREGLYSTPLSWEKPQPGLRMDSMLSLNNPGSLNEADQQRLLAIAMNSGPSTGGLGANIASTFGPHFGAHAYVGAHLGMAMGQASNAPSQGGPAQSALGKNLNMPQTKQPPAKAAAKSGGSEKGKDKSVKGDRTAHNDIERKYRTNLKDKISELRDAVPALRPIPENGTSEEADSTGQSARPPKVSKGTVLTKATEYIHWLERRNKAIMREHAELSRRLQAFEQLLNATTRQSYTMPNYSRTLFDPRGFC